MQPEPRNPAWLNRLVQHPGRLWAVLIAAILLFGWAIGACLWLVPLKTPYPVEALPLAGREASSLPIWRVTIPRARFGIDPTGQTGEIETPGGTRAGIRVRRAEMRDADVVLDLALDRPAAIPAGKPIRLWLRYPRLLSAFVR